MGFFMKRPLLLLSILSVIVYAFVVPGIVNAQWVATSGPPGPSHSLAASGGNVFAGTPGGGVFLTTNNGTSWSTVNTGLTNLNVNALAVSGGNIFAGTNGGGVFLTANNGTSWTPVNTGLTMMTVNALAVSGSNLFAGTNGGGVYLTTNNGTSWTPVNTGLTNLTIYALLTYGNNIFAGSNGGGVFLSSNNGTSWSAVSTGLTNLNIYALMVSGSNVFAGAQVSPGVWRRPLSDLGIPAVPAAPTLSSPANGATMVSEWPTWIWNAVTGATTYHIQISRDSSFSLIWYNDSTLTTTSYPMPGYDQLPPSTTVYWRVRAKNSSGTSEWSAVWHFTTIMDPPIIPSLISPANGATIAVPNVAFFSSAESIAYASYGMSISTQPDFSTSVTTSLIASGGTSSRYCWVRSGLLNNTTYYWRVLAVNPAGSAYSSTWSFTMAFDTTPRCFAHWSFDSSAGTTYYDVTGNGYDATATGTGVGLASGVIGQALDCPDTGYDIAVANSLNNFNLTRFSIECWAYLNVNPSQYPVEAKIFEHQYLAPSGGTRNGYTLYIEPTGHVAFTLASSNGGAWEQATSSTVITEKTWYLLTATFDSSYLRLYINGALNASLTYQGTYLAPGANSRIGCQKRTNGVVSRFLNGMIDELKLYNYALPPDSVAAHYLPTAVKQTQNKSGLTEFLKVQTRNSLLTITLPSAMLGKVFDVSIYSASGRELVKKSVRSGAARFTLPINGFSRGAYVLAVKDGNRKVTARFAVLR